MHTVNDYLSDVGSEKAVSFMVPEKNGPPIVYFLYHDRYPIYLSIMVPNVDMSIIGCRQAVRRKQQILVYANFRGP